MSNCIPEGSELNILLTPKNICTAKMLKKTITIFFVWGDHSLKAKNNEYKKTTIAPTLG